MDTQQIVTLLIAERDRLTNAIEALQGPPAAKRRGRPPKNSTAGLTAPVATAPAAATPDAAPKPGKRKPRTAAQKRAQAERMRAYWAAKKKRK